MNPFFFGSSAQPLYGVHHPHKAQQMRQESVLLCPPFGQEYMRSHRAYRQLAMLLAMQGYSVMRFDYRGTGDSSGEIENATVEGWLEDIDVAVEELKETACVDKVNVVGLRLGALLAAAASTGKSQIHKLVLWDPVISGTRYDEELQKAMQMEGASVCNRVDENETLHFNGFPLVKKLRQELGTLDLLDLNPKADKVFNVISQENDSSRILKNAWNRKTNYTYELAPAPGDWNYVDEFGGILLPQPVIQAIVNWMVK
ncbi:MAG: alpha/beta hydrolase [Pseudomonadales bacterium]|nr:alpha/beta hydrolase [Pseudomonadales bacterium]